MNLNQVLSRWCSCISSLKESEGLFAAKRLQPGAGNRGRKQPGPAVVDNAFACGRLCLAILLLGAATAPASPVDEAAASYEKGDFVRAARTFETALASGPKSAGLYFNLGQSLKKEGDAGAAVLNFRRALMLDPRLADARMALSDTERAKGIPLAATDWRDLLAERVALFPLLVVSFGIFWLGAFWLLAGLWLRSGPFAMTAAFLLAVIGAAGFSAVYLADPRFAWRSAAVVISPEGASLLSAPADRSDVLAKLPPGSTVTWKRESGDWAYCATPDGKSGWMQAARVERVLPDA